MKSIFKIVYPGKKLKLAGKDGYLEKELVGRKLDVEVKDERRCVGHHSARGEMSTCPEFRKIEKGDQCPECTRKDIYGGWRRGESSPEFDAEYSVYLAMCGSGLKVGVSRTSRLENRWREQGADFAAELLSGISGEEALEKEKELSDKGIKERVRKEKKLEEADSRILSGKIEELGFDADIETVYGNSLRAETLVRKGPVPSPVKNVVGQIVSNGRLAMAMTSGKILVEKEQKDLGEF